MIHSKAIDVLRTFTKEELKQFSAFVRSPFFNKNKNLIVLLDSIKSFHPEFNMENEEIYSVIYPGKIYSGDNMKKLMSGMSEVLERFLIQSRFDKENFIKKIFLLQECDYRCLDSMFLNSYNKFNKEFDDVKALYYEKALFETTALQFYLYREKVNLSVDYIFRKSEYNLCYFLFQYLQCMQDIQNVRKNHNIKNEISALELFSKRIDIEKYVKELEKSKPENSFLLLVCNLILLLSNPDKEEYFFNAKKILMKFPVVKEAYYENFYQYLTFLENYCKTKSEKGIYRFKYEYFDLIKLGLSIRNPDDIYYCPIDTKEYSNIIKTSVFTNEIKWMKQFIKWSSEYKHIEQRENMINYGMAFLKYAEKDFEESLRYISLIDYTDITKKMDMKILKLWCYYELNFFESAISIIDSLRHFVVKSEFTDSFKKKHKSHLIVVNNLFHMKLNPEKIDENEIQKIKSDAEYFPCITKKWICDKADELEKTYIFKTKRMFRKTINTT